MNMTYLQMGTIHTPIETICRIKFGTTLEIPVDQNYE